MISVSVVVTPEGSRRGRWRSCLFLVRHRLLPPQCSVAACNHYAQPRSWSKSSVWLLSGGCLVQHVSLQHRHGGQAAGGKAPEPSFVQEALVGLGLVHAACLSGCVDTRHAELIQGMNSAALSARAARWPRRGEAVAGELRAIHPGFSGLERRWASMRPSAFRL